MYFIAIIIFTLCTFLAIKIAKSTNVLRPSFWLVVIYSFLLITHFFAGIRYHSGDIYRILPYFLLCIILLVMGERVGRTIKLRRWAIDFKVKLKSLGLISIIGSIIFIFDILRSNQINFGTRIEDFNVSIVGVVGNAMSSLGIIVWLSSLYYYRINKIRIPAISYISVIGFVAGTVLSAGRQVLFMVIISSVVLLIWSAVKRKELRNEPQELPVKKAPTPWGIYIILMLFGCYFMFISAIRSGIFDIDNKIDSQEKFFNATVSAETKNTIHSIGGLADIYLEFSYYYSHELTHLDLLYQYYDYPPTLGLSQMPYIERRLEWLVGDQNDKVESEVEVALENKGGTSAHTWGTFVADYIVDFGRIGAPFACLTTGILMGALFRKFKSDENPLTVIRQVIICTGVIFSIQYSPISELAYFIPLMLSSFMIVSN
jgi:oligosaccharide repeat unit polymerase